MAYDELPEGSALRRDYDGRGGVTITAPAGELSAPVRRAALRSAMVSALLASAACLLVVGYLVLDAARSNRFDPALRGAAAVALAVLAGGVFLFVWLTRYSMLSDALADARRCSSVLHADATRLLVETVTTSGPESIDLPADRILAVNPADVRARGRRAAPVQVPCLAVTLRDGRVHHLLHGHHPAELRWVGVTLSHATKTQSVR